MLVTRTRKLLTFIGLAGLLGLYMTRVATHWLRITRLRIGLPALPEEWLGLRIALLTDFHAGGKQVSLELLENARREAIAFEPDIIVLGGDFYDEARRIETGGLFTSWPNGIPVVAVTGNHDYRGGPAHLHAMLEELDSAGVQILHNEAVVVRLRGRTAWIAGVDDPHTRRDDVTKAFESIPEGEPALVLIAHSPTSAVNLPAGRARLLLAGHTHGGQIRLLPSGRLPFIRQIRSLRGLRPHSPLPYVRGQAWHQGTIVAISDGLGQSTVGARFRTRPELVLLELVNAPSNGPACDNVERYVTYQGDEPRLLRWLT